MIRILYENDEKLLIDLYKKINHNSKNELNNLLSRLNKDKIVVANIDNNEITSILIATLIKNDYYLEDVIFLRNDIDEVKNIIRHMIEALRKDERGLSIIYDNIPYSESMHQIMIDLGFKCQFINYETEDNRIELIKTNITINETTDEVSKYMLSHYEAEFKSISKYLGDIVIMPDKIDINKTNIAVAKDKDNKIVGVLRFGLITDSIYISNIYADTNEVYIDLINLIKNITNRKIEIGIYPIRDNLINVLNYMGFKKTHSDYKYEL